MKIIRTALVFIFGIAVGAMLLNPNWTQKSHAGVGNLPSDLFYIVQNQPAKQYFTIKDIYSGQYKIRSAGIAGGGKYFYIYVDRK